MADEPNQSGNEEKPTPEKGGEVSVNMTQSKLDSLINDKFKQGATKANADLLQSLGVESIDDIKNIIKAKSDADEASKTELEKALETIEASKTENAKLQTDYAKLQEDNNINSIAAKHGVTEVDYFKLEYNAQKGKEGFNIDTFMTGIKESKPMLFGGGVKPPASDNSRNSDKRNVNKFKDMSIEELRAYQNTL